MFTHPFEDFSPDFNCYLKVVTRKFIFPAQTSPLKLDLNSKRAIWQTHLDMQ